MSALILALAVLLAFLFAYRFYGGILERLWQIDPKRPTPAFSKFDSVDYIPAKNWLVMFGHHFSSIAGAGPIIGPVMAVMLWGWMPAVVWVIFGSIFIGGVHDFGSLITSVREGGSSIAEIAGNSVTKKAKIFFALFIWLALILVIAVFAYFCAETFIKDTRIILPSLGLIPVAIVVGFLLYKVRMNSFLATLIGLSFMALLLWAGTFITFEVSGIKVWLAVLFIYAYIASILPVNILLQPRDYLASFLLFFGLAAGFLGLIISRPLLTMPPFIRWSTGSGELWPMLFVIVACGAVSGFHTLIASGTTSKQIASERHVKRIGYAAMLVEGLVAILAVIAAAILFKKGDDFSAALSSLKPIGIFAGGFGLITKVILGSFGTFIAVVILNAFILTTLDTATRVARYITEELSGIKNRYLSTAIVIAVSAPLAFSGKWNKLWPVFGASNQLVASLALFVLSCWLISKGKSGRITLFPALFMFATAFAALLFQASAYFKQGDSLLFAVSLILILLAGFMLFEAGSTILRKGKKICLENL